MIKKPNKSWKEVKLSGHLITDDSGGGLEGLIGLEVLEDYDHNIVSKTIKSYKGKRPKFNTESDSENDEPVKKSKKTKQKKKENITKKEEENKKEPDSVKHLNSAKIPGQFVLLKPPGVLVDKPKKKKRKDGVGEKSRNEFEKTSLDLDELEGWNGMGINDLIMKAIAENGYKTPTQIQSLTIPSAILGKRDILGAAETGSGKTLAFGIPVLNGILFLKEKFCNGEKDVIFRKIPNKKKIKKSVDESDEEEEENFTEDELNVPKYEDSDENDTDSDANENDTTNQSPLYALVLTPTRELAVQVRDHIKTVAKYTGIKVVAIFGGFAHVKQERLLKKCPEVVVATPGRLWELLQEGNAHLSKIDNINFLVIDETDRMVERGHFEELKLLINRLNDNSTKKCQRQNFVFSATLTIVHELPDYLQKINQYKSNRFLKTTPGQKIQSLIETLGISQPKVVDITQNRGTAESLTECRITCDIDQKDFYLYYFLQKHPGRTIVFCNSIDCVKRLGQLFSILECQPLPLHANMAQRQRLKNLERFRSNPYAVLIATDVAARGLDIPNVQHVIHYQVPRTSENYVHRSGRTARANQEGIAILIMEPAEVKNYIKLCHTLGRTEDLPLFPVSSEDLKAVKARVLLARDIDKLELKMRRYLSEIGWRNKMAEEADMIVNESDHSSDIDSDTEVTETNKDKRMLKTKRAMLAKLLAKPISPKGFSYKYPSSSGKFENPIVNGGNPSKTAINVMKDAIEENKQDRKKRNSEKILNKRKYNRL